MTTHGENEGILRRAAEAVEEKVEAILGDDEDDAFTKRPGAKDET